MNANYLKDDIKKSVFLNGTFIRYKTILTEDILPDDIGRNQIIEIKDFKIKYIPGA